MNNTIKKNRIPVELQYIRKTQKEHGITCVPHPTDSDDYSELLATIPGPQGSPYEAAQFQVRITLGEQYPFRPATFKFLTPVYHPNIDASGKICLDLLRMPPTGSYNPAITLESILLSIQLLLASPNPEDPLRGDAADLYKTSIELFNSKAREELQKHKLVETSDNLNAQIKDLPNEGKEKNVLSKEVAKKKLKLCR